MSHDEEMKRFSKSLLGSSHRLVVGAAVGEAMGQPVSARGLAKDTSIADNLVSNELDHFAAAGILFRLPRPAGQQVQYYQPLSSTYWEFCIRLLEELRARGPGGVASLPRPSQGIVAESE